MLDLSTAFDKLDHSILLEIIGFVFGVGETASNWFKSYLSKKTRQVQIKETADHRSATGILPCPCAVHNFFWRPVLDHRNAPLRSPILCRRPPRLPVIQTHSLYESDWPSHCHRECVAELRSWMISNIIMVNNNKTQVLIEWSKQQLERVTIANMRMVEDKITAVMSVQNLAVILDSNFKMDMENTKAHQNAYNHLHNIRRIQKFLGQEVACTIIYAFIKAKLTTATVWWIAYQRISPRND